MMLAVSDQVIITTLIISAMAPIVAAVVGVLNNFALKKVHGLVNSAMTLQKHLTSLALRRVADITKDPEDIKLANDAEKIYNEALSAQLKQP